MQSAPELPTRPVREEVPEQFWSKFQGAGPGAKFQRKLEAPEQVSEQVQVPEQDVEVGAEAP